MTQADWIASANIALGQVWRDYGTRQIMGEDWVVAVTDLLNNVPQNEETQLRAAALVGEVL